MEHRETYQTKNCASYFHCYGPRCVGNNCCQAWCFCWACVFSNGKEGQFRRGQNLMKSNRVHHTYFSDVFLLLVILSFCRKDYRMYDFMIAEPSNRLTAT
uniref:Uncharacterized protein n=1 Tax=Rhipicephalus zambeziensis TaxID=60191 RepID=A0A224Y6E2_9ACAR